MKKILITMQEAGAGHKIPALAVKEALDRLYPGLYQVDVVDFVLASGAAKADRAVKDLWDVSLAHPWIAKAGYRFIDGLWPVSLWWNNNSYPDFKKSARSYLDAYQPDLIFSTNHITASASVRARDALGLKAKAISFVTDPFDAWGFWADSRMDLILVASERARAQLLKRRIPAERISVVEFPLQRKFFAPLADAEGLRQKLGLKPGVPTLLTSEGGQGIGPIANMILELHKSGMACNVIAVCGKNELLRATLVEKATSPSATHLVPLGFVDNMHELLGLADVCLVKAGASTTFEALVKQVPILFSSWASYNEKPNIDYCVEHGVGWYTPDSASFLEQLRQLVTTDALKQAKDRLKELNVQSGTDAIAQILHQKLEETL